MAAKELRFTGKSQEDFFYAPAGGVLGFYGGFGSGKSTILCVKILWIADTFPGAQVALVRRTASQLRKTTVATLLTWLPAERISRYNEQAGVIELKNGSKIYLLHLDAEDSLGMLKSLELTAAGVDQAEEVEVKAIDLLEKRVGRWRGVTIPPALLTPEWPWKDHTGEPIAPKWMLLTFNCPGFDSYLWTRFAEESPERAAWAARGYRHITASSRDNPFLGESNLESLLAAGGEFVERYVDVTTWGITEGRVFDLNDMSILEPEGGLVEKIKRGMKLHRSLDHGDTAPTCCLWFATDHDQNVFVWREYYQEDRLVSDHRAAICALSKDDHTKYYSNLADPSIFAKTRGRTASVGPRWSVAEEYSDTKLMSKETAIYWTAADNGEEVTRSRMKEYLRIDPNHRHPITGKKGAPHLYFLRRTNTFPNGCLKVIQELRSQRYVSIGEGADGKQMFSEERDPKVSDHAVDALRYFVVSRPSLGAGPTRPEAKPGDLYIDDYFRMDEAIKIGRRRKERMLGVSKAGYG